MSHATVTHATTVHATEPDWQALKKRCNEFWQTKLKETPKDYIYHLPKPNFYTN